MDFIIEELPVQNIVYMRRIGAYGTENYILMAKLKEWADKNGLLKDSIIYGIAQDNPANTPENQCCYDVCLIVKDDYPLDESIQRGEIPSGKYAIFTIPHTAEAVKKFWGTIMQEEKLQFDKTKPILERYKYKLVENGECEFCVPIL